MTTGVEFISTLEAARALGVSVQQVRRLAAAGELTRVAHGVINRDSLDRHMAQRQGGRTRVWAPHTAWGAIAMLSGMQADWLSPTQASRIRAWLRGAADAADLITQTRDRASVKTYYGHPAAVGRLLDELVTTDEQGLGLVSPSPGAVDGYLAMNRLDDIVDFFGLRHDPGGIVTIRATTIGIRAVRDVNNHGVVLAALDAATSTDPRRRGVGERALTVALDRYRR